MEAFNERLAGHPVIGLDTPVFIYHFEAHARYAPLTAALLAQVEQGVHAGATSIITLMEINVRPLALGREDVARRYEALLANFPNLLLVDINRDIARRAAQLRAQHNLRPADALQAAACLQAGCSAFVTNDRLLQRLASSIDVILLDDFA